MDEFLKAVDSVSVFLDTLNKQMSLVGHSYMILGVLCNLPLLFIFGVVVTILNTPAGDNFIVTFMSWLERLFRKEF